MQYVVYALDFSDALERRLAVREAHLDGVRRMKAAGTFHLGGALLDDEGRMIGSTMLVEFSTREELDRWLDGEVYVTERVWDRIDVRPFRAASV